MADGLMYWVFSSLGDNVTPTVVTRSQLKLVTTGPYRWVRHPLYSVGFLSYVAFAVLAANWFVATIGHPCNMHDLVARAEGRTGTYHARGRRLPRTTQAALAAFSPRSAEAPRNTEKA